MGHVVIAGVDDEPLDVSDGAVYGMDLLTATYAHLAHGEFV